MARRRITSFQPQAGSVSREVDILGRRGATDIINIGKKIRAQKEAERTFVQKTLDNIENLKEESALIHRTAFNSEVDNLKQLTLILGLKFNTVLFDNMNIKNLKLGVKLAKKYYETEASGNINFKTVKSVAATGVNRISIGSITHSAPAIDFKIEF